MWLLFIFLKKNQSQTEHWLHRAFHVFCVLWPLYFLLHFWMCRVSGRVMASNLYSASSNPSGTRTSFVPVNKILNWSDHSHFNGLKSWIKAGNIRSEHLLSCCWVGYITNVLVHHWCQSDVCASTDSTSAFRGYTLTDSSYHRHRKINDWPLVGAIKFNSLQTWRHKPALRF